MAINNIIVSGNVGKDCELRVTQNGKGIASFSIAVTQGYGEHEKTSWLTCRIFGKKAEAIHHYIKKGDNVTVNGEYVTNEWEKDGVNHLQPTIIVNQIQLAKKQGAQQATQPQQQSKASEPPMDFDDVPF